MANGERMLDQLLVRARAAADRARAVRGHSEALQALHESAVSRTPRRCAWCGRIEIGGAWRDEDSVPGFFKARRDPESVSHGICEECLEELRQTGRSR
jgi:hypothetical protein